MITEVNEENGFVVAVRDAPATVGCGNGTKG
jgi:hypothetical protein